MENNIKLNFEFTVSKIAGLYLILAGPFLVESVAAITVITIGAGLLGFKQAMDTVKKIKGSTNE